jgi:membrane protease YdiL (CAAX protease family)
VLHINHEFLSLLPFLLLLAAVFGLWIGPRVWVPALVLAVVAGYLSDALYGGAAAWVLILAGLALLFRSRRMKPELRFSALQRVLAGLGFLVFALVMGLLLLPGFNRTVLVEALVLSPGAAPYGIGLGFPKVVAGIFVLGIINHACVGSWRELGVVLKRTAPVFAITLIAVMACALLLGYVRADPKWTTLFLVWAPVNLFFTCLAEEAFFRGFVQHEIAQSIQRKHLAAIVAIGVSALLFGLSHFAGGWKYVLAGTIAGVGYGWAYHRTQRIEAAMAVHFGVNAVHFLFFTYPGLRAAGS